MMEKDRAPQRQNEVQEQYTVFEKEYKEKSQYADYSTCTTSWLDKMALQSSWRQLKNTSLKY